ncbi:MAG: circularly permuted type 2 ATP-grasp protein [Synoicihabitans sp.]
MIREFSASLLDGSYSVVTARSRTLPKIPPAQLRPLRNRLRQSVRDAGLTDFTPHETSTKTPFWELEPTPLIISASEWRKLESATIQRARIINALLQDLYAEQKIMRAGVLPAELTLADPYYRRACWGLHPDRIDPASLIRFDLIKTSEGWRFTETHTNTPVGLSYAIQNRRFLTQEAADYYRALPDYHSIINAPLQLVDTLRNLGPRQTREPSMVFLTTGPQYPFFSEHSFLARKMGLRLAQGDDLLVLDNRVYFKTIAGLEPVDIIYRRVNDAHIDPVVFSTDLETAGIPGLIQCIRAGTVTVANAIGSGVAENRALHGHMAELARFYLSERLELPSIKTLWCRDNDQLDAILDDPKAFEIWPTHSARLDTPQVPSPKIKGGQLPKAIRENPANFVARPARENSGNRAKSPAEQPMRLSLFALTAGRRTSIIPGGIINIGPPPYPRKSVGKCGDVIVLSDGESPPGSLSDFESENNMDSATTVPSSRAAESLFWLGRYLERAESTSRMVGILDDVALEEIPAADRRKWLPVWRGLLAATGHADHKVDARAKPEAALTGDLIWRMTLGKHPSSLLNIVASAESNAQQLRSYLSPETSRILTKSNLSLREAARQSPVGRDRLHRERRNQLAKRSLDNVLVEINACLGSTARTMLQDAGWHFLKLGKQIERASLTGATLRHVLPAAAKHAESAQKSDTETFRDNPELSALLRMLGSQDAYRRLYRTRSQPLQVARLLIKQPHAPRSLLYSFRAMSTSLIEIEQQCKTPEARAPRALINDRIEEISSLNLIPFFSPGVWDDADAATLESALDRLNEGLAEIHQSLEDHFFSHQARLSDFDLQRDLDL